MTFNFKGKILVPRLNRLSHLPPALYASQILEEKGYPLLIVEFGRLHEDQKQIESPLPRLRWQSSWARWLPRKSRPLAIFSAVFFRLLFRFLTDGRPQLMIAHGMQEQCLVYLLNLIFRVPFVVQVHEVYEPHELDGMNRFFFRLGVFALKKARFLIFPEKSRAALYRERYQLKSPIYIVYNCPRRRNKTMGFDLREKLGLARTTKLVAYLGGIGCDNGLEEAVAALVELPQVVLLVWGWGEKRYVTKLRELTRQLGVEHRVLFLGELNEEKWSYLDSCDLGYCVYRPERLRYRYGATASNKLMESLAAGLPVITSANEDFKEIVEGFEVGKCACRISSSAIADSLRELVNDEVASARLSKNALAAHSSDLNYEKQFSQAALAFGKLLLTQQPESTPSKAFEESRAV